MTGDEPANVRKLVLRPGDAEARVHALAVDTSNIRWSRHARDRMEERGIDDTDALRALQRGHCLEDPVPGKGQGEWKVKMVWEVRGSRDIGVVTIIMREGRLRVVTVEWEDLK